MTIKDKDVSVLVGLKEKEWDTNTSDLKDYVNGRNDLEDLSLTNINYRVNKKFNNKYEDSLYDWIETEDRGETETGANKAKRVYAVDKEGILEALEENVDKYIDDYEGTKSFMKTIDKRSQNNQRVIEEINEKVNSKAESDKVEDLILTVAVLTDSISNKDLKTIKRVADDNDELTLKDVIQNQ